jgi:hypothetical protein
MVSDKISQQLPAAGMWFSLGTPVSSTNNLSETKLSLKFPLFRSKMIKTRNQ